MTYCVAMMLERGLIFMSDTRTNAGVDDVSRVKKMHTFEISGERSMILLSSGNLATTQAVVGLLEERSKAPDDRDPSIFRTLSMFQTAKLVGETLNEVVANMRIHDDQPTAHAFSATMILGGQIAGSDPRLFLIYPEGNFIEAKADNPFFQIGEIKYGRPILSRAYDPQMDFAEAAKLLLISFDSTLRSNLSVGLPIDMGVYKRDSFKVGPFRRFDEHDEDFRAISHGWSDALKHAFSRLPDLVVPDE
ncbi:peptidase [Notoacmeibacter ruber]|uniref:Peptidase n=1 Tax=Notoacmeibacter ruber TaxID=2670375 RepID=A0A3L7JBB7_9HYPH|nr:peptidase [Notoacmeibacter ruber]RLQ87780.1 peptidase [Notoacmeibacter ruber]